MSMLSRNHILQVLQGSFLFIGWIFSSATLHSETLDRYKTVIMLQEEGGINWVPYASSEKEKAMLFDILSEIVRNPTGLTTAIQNRALLEAGKFATDESGHLRSEASRLYDEQAESPIQNSNDTTLRMSYILSLENAFVPESVTYLTRLSRVDDRAELNENSTSLAALDALALVLQPDPQGRPPLPDTEEFQFSPRFGVPLNERQRAQEWMEAAQTALTDLKAMGEDSSHKKIKHKKIQAALEHAEKSLRAFLSTPKNNLESATPKPSTSDTPKPETAVTAESNAIDTVESEPEPEAADKKLYIAGIVVVLVVLNLALLWSLRRRKNQPKDQP